MGRYLGRSVYVDGRLHTTALSHCKSGDIRSILPQLPMFSLSCVRSTTSEPSMPSSA